MTGPRFKPLPPEQMTAEQKRVAQEIAQGPRGGLRGPFPALLRIPALADRVRALGDYVRFESSLPPPLSELAILVVARFWTAQYEWYAHSQHAVKAGIDPSIPEAIAQGRRPDEARAGPGPDLRLLHGAAAWPRRQRRDLRGRGQALWRDHGSRAREPRGLLQLRVAHPQRQPHAAPGRRDAVAAARQGVGGAGALPPGRSRTGRRPMSCVMTRARTLCAPQAHLNGGDGAACAWPCAWSCACRRQHRKSRYGNRGSARGPCSAGRRRPCRGSG